MTYWPPKRIYLLYDVTNLSVLFANLSSFFIDLEKRYQVAKEILDTEKKYLSCLRTLKEVRFIARYWVSTGWWSLSLSRVPKFTRGKRILHVLFTDSRLLNKLQQTSRFHSWPVNPLKPDISLYILHTLYISYGTDNLYWLFNSQYLFY